MLDRVAVTKPIAETVFDSFAPQLDLSFDAAIKASLACFWALLRESCSRRPFCLGVASPAEGKLSGSLPG